MASSIIHHLVLAVALLVLAAGLGWAALRMIGRFRRPARVGAGLLVAAGLVAVALLVSALLLWNW